MHKLFDRMKVAGKSFLISLLVSIEALIIESSPWNPPRYSLNLTWLPQKIIDQVADSVRGQGNVVEIGCFEGGTTSFLVNRLVLPEDPWRVYAFDTWHPHVEGKSGMYFRPWLYDRFMHNVGRFGEKVVAVRGRSQETLPPYRQQLEGTVIFAYIDGEHTASAVFEDAVNVLPLMKPGGYMLFDDYLWKDHDRDPVNTPKAGIDRFLAEHEGEVAVVVSRYQLLAQKR